MGSDVVDSTAAFFQPLFLRKVALSPAILVVTLALGALLLFPGGIAWLMYSPLMISGRRRSKIPGPLGVMTTALSSSMAHRALASLAKSLGATELMAFSVGITRFIMSSHPETAREILNSSAFANRPIKESAYELLFHRAMGFAPFGEYWRNLRRISATYLFSPKRIVSLGKQRMDIGERMVEEMRDLMEKEGAVKVRSVLHFGSLNNVMMTVFGKRYDFARKPAADHDDGSAAEELETLVKEGYELLGMFNWSDHLPLLGRFDLQGVRRRCRKLVVKVNAFVTRIIEDHRMKRAAAHPLSHDDKADQDFVDVLLDLEEDEKLADSDMVALLWEMIFRGTDTVAILMEWIMARMVLHPDIQAKAQAEIDAATEGSSRPVSDCDIKSLPYLQAIVKETLRMHPPGPLLSWARMAIHDVQVGNHLIPAGTTAMVNMWAITHDKNIWSDPDQFKPERFTATDDRIDEINILGSDLRLAPFGSGRRVCPGKAMALAAVHLWFAQLLQNFKWLPATACPVDLSECLRMSLEMKNPLLCRVTSRFE